MSFSSPTIRFGFSERSDGNMKLLYDGVLDVEAVENRRRFFQALGIDVARTVATRCVHGTEIAVITEEQAGAVFEGFDGLVTNVPNLYLTVTGADCVPVYIVDPVHHAIGLAHSGWRGAVQNMAAALVQKMASAYGSSPEDLQVRIGPRIQQHHFEVQEEVERQFAAYPDCIEHRDGKIFVDLGRVIATQLAQVGVLPTNIEQDDTCTYCEESRYFSYRRDKPEKLEVMVAYLGMGE